jgi:hypothetical protein
MRSAAPLLSGIARQLSALRRCVADTAVTLPVPNNLKTLASPILTGVMTGAGAIIMDGAVSSVAAVTGASLVVTSTYVKLPGLVICSVHKFRHESAGRRERLWAVVDTPDLGDYSLGVDTSTLWYRAPTCSKHSFQCDGNERASISGAAASRRAARWRRQQTCW